MKMNRFYAPGWPNTDWTQIPSGYRWVTLRKSAIPFIWIRGVDGAEHKLFAGHPFPLDPSDRYSVLVLGFPTSHRTTHTLEGPKVTSANPTAQVRDNATELLLSDEPTHGAVVRYAARWGNIATESFTVLRIPTEGSDFVSVRVRCDGAGDGFSVQTRPNETDDADAIFGDNPYTYSESALTVNLGALHTFGMPGAVNLYVPQFLELIGVFTFAAGSILNVNVVQRAKGTQ